MTTAAETTPAAAVGAPPTRPWLRAVVSALLVLGSFAGGLMLLYGILRAGPVGPRQWLDIGVGAAGCLLLLLRRRFPVVIGLVLAVVAAVIASAGVANMVALYAVARRRRLPVAVAVGLADVAAGIVFWLLYPGNNSLSLTVVVNVAISAAAVAWGSMRQTQSALVASYRERAERAELEQQLRAEQARSDERTRIAREMHDAVAHRISLVALHAGGLAVMRDPSTDRVHEAAELIRGTAVQALEDVRSTLGVLRGGEPRPLAQPGLDRIPDLVAEAQRAGQEVAFSYDCPDAGRVPPAIGRDAYRIVQEGLTNARKHAAGVEVEVAVGTAARRVRVTVRNRSSDAALALPGGGRGLIGLRERVELAGGNLRVTDGAGEFVLLADLPYGATT